MNRKEQANGDKVDRINALNEIFDDVISDATELIKDLYWGVKNYLFFGLISILFGVSEILYSMDSLAEQHYVPVFIAGALIFSGAAQIFNYFRLSKKYARLFRAQNELKKT